MGIDIRLPIGGLFSLLGVLLTGYGLFSNSDLYERSLGINVNLRWGLFMLAFGLAMIAFGRRRTQENKSSERGSPAEQESTAPKKH